MGHDRSTGRLAAAMPKTAPFPAHASANRAAIALLLIGLVARLALAVLLDPGVDEAYAVAVSRQVQLSWFDHPPMTFWWVAAARALAVSHTGDPVPAFVLRLPFVLAFTVTSWLIFDLTRRLWGARAGLWALAALTLAPFFFTSAGSWIVPDGPLILFLAATARILVEILFFRPEGLRERRLWLLAGLCLGLAGLSKYHAALFAFGAFAFLLATPHRFHLARPAPWIAAAIALVVVSPVLVWNAEHDWVSFLFQSSRGGAGRGVSWPGLGRAVLGQMLYLAPWTLIATVAATASRLRAERSLAGPGAFLAAVALPSILIFTALPLRGGDALPHWQMPGWLFLLPVLGKAIAARESEAGAPSRLAHGFAVASTALLALAAAAVLLLRFAPASLDVAATLRIESFLSESLRWRGLADGLLARGLLPQTPPPPGTAAKDRPLVVAFHWIDAARISEELGDRATVAVFGPDPRGFAFLSDPADFVGRDVLVVGRPKTYDRGHTALVPFLERLDLQEPIRIHHGATRLFDAEIAIGRRLKRPYPLPYPTR
mgnify:CR=1 FL=1